jgi:hypothetical protein
VTNVTGGTAVAPPCVVNPRPEIVLPPGFALRIDYDPESSPASLLITAYRDDAPVGQAHVAPRDVGHRLRLELEMEPTDAAETLSAPRLRLTPQRAMRAILMEAVRAPVQPRELLPRIEEPLDIESRDIVSELSAAEERATTPPGLTALQELTRDGALRHAPMHDGREGIHAPNALVWLNNGTAVVLPCPPPGARPLASAAAHVGRRLRDDVVGDHRAWSKMQRALRALVGMATELVSNPLRLREADESWISWRASWRAVQHPTGAGER